MPNYKEMYLLLFRSMTKAITILQEAQQQAEEMYTLEQQSDIRVLDVQRWEKNLSDNECEEETNELNVTLNDTREEIV